MWFCGLSCITATSRCVYALARDHGTPKADFFRRVNKKRGTPGPAIWGVVIATMAMMAWSGAISVVTSLSTVGLYCAFIIPVFLGWRARRAGSLWPQQAVWSLGRWGSIVNLVAIVYTVFISVVLVMPPNELAGKTLAGVVGVLSLIYLVRVRHKFQAPAWAKEESGVV